PLRSGAARSFSASICAVPAIASRIRGGSVAASIRLGMHSPSGRRLARVIARRRGVGSRTDGANSEKGRTLAMAQAYQKCGRDFALTGRIEMNIFPILDDKIGITTPNMPVH